MPSNKLTKSLIKIGNSFKDTDRSSPTTQSQNTHTKAIAQSREEDIEVADDKGSIAALTDVQERTATPAQVESGTEGTDNVKGSAGPSTDNSTQPMDSRREPAQNSEEYGQSKSRRQPEVPRSQTGSQAHDRSNDRPLTQQARSQSHSQQGYTRSNGGGWLSSLSQGSYQDPQPSRQDLERHIDKLRGALQERDIIIDERDAVIESLQRTRNQLQESTAQVEHELRQLQEASFKSIEDPRWMPLDDSTVQREFISLQSGIDRYSKAFAGKSLDGIGRETEATQTLLLSSLSAVVRFNQKSLAALNEVAALGNAPRLCLSALLSHAIHTTFFDNPFFFMDDGFDDLDASTKTVLSQHPELTRELVPSKSFLEFYQTAKRVDLREANIWRSQTVRLLHPPVSQHDKPSETVRCDVEQATRDACRDAARVFASGPASLLTQGLADAQREECRRSLEALFEGAGKLAVRLWTLRPAIRCDYLPDLQHRLFAVDSPAMQAHALHKLDDPADDRFDGRPVKIVVHPAVFGMGTHDADAYDRPRVWAKAVLWLDV